MPDTRQLSDLRSVGPAAIEDFRVLGITRAGQLKGRNPQKLYEKLCRVTGKKHDICVLDLFQCAIAQANNPNLPSEQKDWYYWSRKRKAVSR